MMRRVWLGIALLPLLLSAALSVHAQQAQFAYRITFTDKQAALQGSPSLFLSQRALDRRAAKSIALDSTDLPVWQGYIDDVLTLTSGKLHVTSRWLNECVVLLTDSTKIHLIENKPYVTGVTYVAYFPNGLHKQTQAVNPKFAAEQALTAAQHNAHKTTGTVAYYGNTFTQTDLVNGDTLHDLGYKGAGKLIAVLDAGFSGVNTHPVFDSLQQSGRLVEVHNFVLATDIVYGYDTHGTEVLSTMAGNVPGTFVGSAPEAYYALYVTEDDNREAPYELDNMVAAMERADSLGADVITTSLGYTDFNNPVAFTPSHSTLDGKTTVAARGVNAAVQKGIFVAASAGNEGGNSWNFIITPGDADSALTVGAVNFVGTPANFTSPGPNSASRIKPDVCLMGEGVALCNGSSYVYDNGTSFSTPQAAGYAACLLQAASVFALPGDVRNAIDSSADHFTSPTNQLGYGVPNFGRAFRTLIANVGIPDTGAQPTGVRVWPVPATKGLINVRILQHATAPVTLKLYDAKGSMVWTGIWSVSNPIYTIAIPQGLPGGVYILNGAGKEVSFSVPVPVH